MSKLRSVSTAFWSDPFIEELSPNQKLLFLYLMTNEKTNMLGIYESSIKKISFETDIPKVSLKKDLELLVSRGKVKYIDNYIILVNYMKHQNFNVNMKKSAIDIYNALPNVLKDSTVIVSKSNPLKGFESLLNHYGMVSKVEAKVEDELEDEDKPKKKPKGKVDFDSQKYKNELWVFLKTKIVEYSLDDKKVAEEIKCAYDFYRDNDWKNSNNKPVLNLKTTIWNNWLKSKIEELKKPKNHGNVPAAFK